MSFVIGTLIAIFFLEGVGRYALIAAVALLELAEIGLWLKWRNVTSSTGAESLVGMFGVALSDCKPDGQVKVKGQIWKARCDEGVGAGEGVSVVAVDGLRLDVAPR
jgi:membrane protein implicated in regulation of membrane protease activity